MELKAGLKHTTKTVVTDIMTAMSMKSGALPVFATPMMIAHMENVCFECVLPYLGENEGTVGTLVNISHLAATPVGMEVTFDCELVEIDRRRLVFKVSARDECEKIGEGMHERFIIKEAEFTEKSKNKSPK